MNLFFHNESYFNMKIRNNLNHQTIQAFFKLFNVAKNKQQYLMSNHNIYLNGEVINQDTTFQTGDYLTIETTKFELESYKPLSFKLQILYEDEYLLIVNKPAGFIIYPDDNQKTGTMANIISAYYNEHHINASIRHCHRLDFDTTGCLIYAKDMFTESAMNNLFQKQLIDKTYVAIVEGKTRPKMKIASAIGTDRHINGKMVVKKTGKVVKTNFETISSNPKNSYLKIKIKGGKTHQIRVHLASVLHPLYGDTLYGANTSDRVMLHCSEIKFVHPVLGKKVEVKAPLFPDFKKVLKDLNL